MDRCLSRGNLRVEIDLAAHREAVSLPALRAEKLHLVSNLQVALVEDNIVLRIVSTTAIIIVCRVLDADKASGMHQFTDLFIVGNAATESL